jgi:pyridoxal phosphate enzyme (YggS family)
VSGPIDPTSVAEQVRHVRERIRRAGGGDVTLVAVTKAFGVDAVHAALAAGVDDVGENYAQEMLGKVEQLSGPAPAGSGDPPTPRWHFLGRLQRNKVRSLAAHVHLWQSVDRLELGAEIARRAPGAAVLVQLNLSGQPQKGGCSWGEVDQLVDGLVGLGLEVRGLMGVGPEGAPADARPGFRRLVETADRLGLPERSIGMTDDLEVAVEEGSTMVRVGRDLFGPRPRPDPGSPPGSEPPATH